MTIMGSKIYHLLINLILSRLNHLDLPFPTGHSLQSFGASSVLPALL